jgi:hypothetical protein
LTISRSDALLGFTEINFARNRLQHSVGAASSLDSQIKKTRLVAACGLHGVLSVPRHYPFKTFAEISEGVEAYAARATQRTQATTLSEISAKGIVLNLQLSLAVLIASQVVRRPREWHHFSILIV